jgi:hypothetical protein
VTTTDTTGSPVAQPPAGDPSPPAANCSGCSKPMTAGAARCPHCGLAFGEHQKCPHCGAVADVRPSGVNRFACSVCGGPRIPIDDPAVARSHREASLLREARAAATAISAWRTAAAVAVAFGFFSLLVLWLVETVAPPASSATFVAVAAATVPFLFALFAMRRASANAARVPAAWDGAWNAVATEIARARGSVDGRTFAKLTRIDEASADRILSGLSAKNLMASAVTNEGDLRYHLVGEPDHVATQTSTVERASSANPNHS